MQNHHGLLVIDKPPGLTSRDVVNRAQTWFPRGTRVGHMGTLDPLATGVLVLGIGEATRLTEFVQEMDKVYQAGILLGAVSNTDDADGEVSAVQTAAAPSLATLHAALAHFMGEIEQVPPNFSAIKVTGRRAYDIARRGEKVSLSERKVRIYDIKQLSYCYPHLELEIRCGKGTYIRSLARDLGQRLGCGGLIASLRRLRIGPFTADLATSLDAPAPPALLPLAMAAPGLPALTLEPPYIQQLRQGRPVSLLEMKAHFDEESLIAIFSQIAEQTGTSVGPSAASASSAQGEKTLIGIGKVVRQQLQPVRILAYRRD